MIKDVIKRKEGIFEIALYNLKDAYLPKIKPITQVYGICFNKSGKILIVKVNNSWQLPGGKPKKNETVEETLKREVDEEANVEINVIEPLSYQKVCQKETGKIFYQLRFVAKITKLKKRRIDPAEGKILKRKFIKPNEFLKYCNWGNCGKALMDKAIKWYKNK